MIVATDLTKTFGKVTAVDSVNFRIPRGRVVGFLGSNGAGKTTTIRMIAGFLTPSAGTITVDGHDVVREPLAVRKLIGYLPESTPLYGEMRVVEYLRFRARLFGVPRRARRAAIDNALRRCWLEDVRRRPIGQLSKGYRQRVGLAAALVHEPPVLVLDEPTVGLDPSQIRSFRSLIRELAGRQTVLLSTHLLPEAELTCDEIVMIAGGKVRAQGAVTTLRASAARRRCTIETDLAAAEDALAQLPSVEGVESRTLSDGWTRLVITPKPDAGDRRDVYSRTLRQLGAAMRELHEEAPSLEHLFLDLVGAAPAADAAPEGAKDTEKAPPPSSGADEGAGKPPAIARPPAAADDDVAPIRLSTGPSPEPGPATPPAPRPAPAAADDGVTPIRLSTGSTPGPDPATPPETDPREEPEEINS